MSRTLYRRILCRAAAGAGRILFWNTKANTKQKHPLPGVFLSVFFGSGGNPPRSDSEAPGATHRDLRLLGLYSRPSIFLLHLGRVGIEPTTVCLRVRQLTDLPTDLQKYCVGAVFLN